MKEFYFPGYYGFFDEYQILLKYRINFPEYFYKDRMLAGAYDLPFGLIWNGGRFINNSTYDPITTDIVMKYYHSQINFKLLHTCTNLLIDDYLDDSDCNDFIDKYYQTQDKIIIANPKLHKYLLNKYPTMSFVYSTTLGITDIKKINEITKNNIYVLYYSKNNDNNYLQQLENKSNIEILCAEPCIPNCPSRADHYQAFSKAQKGDIEAIKKFIPCPYKMDIKNLNNLIDNTPHMINNQRVDELYNMGFNKFKISGRQLHPLQLIELFTYYLVLPELRPFVFVSLKAIWESEKL